MNARFLAVSPVFSLVTFKNPIPSNFTTSIFHHSTHYAISATRTRGDVSYDERSRCY